MTISPETVNCRDLISLNSGAGRHFAVVAPTVTPEDAVLRGHFRLLRLRSGLSMHCTDATDLHDLVTQTATNPGLAVSLFLKGRADVSLGTRRFAVNEGGDGAQGFLLTCAQPDLFERRGMRGNRVRKVTIGVPPEWFDGEALGSFANKARGLAKVHNASLRWTPSARQIELAERMIRQPVTPSLLDDLYMECHTLEVVAETLRLLSGEVDQGSEARLGPRERARVRTACDYLDAHDETKIRLDDIAREVGMSASALQRLFKTAFGMSVFEYGRNRKMERAREMLERDRISVTEAAYLTGFSSPANFATAFKRRFGVSPRQVRQRDPA